MAQLPPEARRLLAVAPEDFVGERKKLASSLRESGRVENAKTISELRKPSAVVLAVNRSARDRPQAAEDAARAASRVQVAQVSGGTEAYRQAMKDLDASLGMLEEVALAQLSGERNPSEPMRRRVRELLLAAVATPAKREALVLGVLTDETGASGFEAFEGIEIPARKETASGRHEAPAKRRTDSESDAKRSQEKELLKKIGAANASLRTAERRAREAERERAKAAKSLAALEAELTRLRAR
jgi:hypothetical protein